MTFILLYSPAGTIIKIAFVLVFVIIRLAMKANKNKTTPANFNQQQNFDQQQNFNQQQNPFQQKNQQPTYRDTFTSPENFQSMGNHPPVQTSFACYCMYCGKKFQSIQALQRDTCFKHPKSDQGLQKHVLYNGPGKPNIGF